MTFLTEGKLEMSKWLAGESATAPTHIAVGTGTSASNESDTALDNETFRDAISTTTRESKQITYETIITSTQQNGNDITEVGLVNANTSGTFFNRTVFAAISKTQNFEIQVDITVKVK